MIYPKTKHSETATPIEKIEYIFSLRRAGAFGEAERLLADPALQAEPRAILAQAFGRIHLWDYEGALPVLDKYLSADGPTEYEKLVAQVNRLACFNFLSDSRFEGLFAELESTLTANRHNLLLGNCLEMQSHYLIEQSRWKEASESLDRAGSLLESDGGRSFLYVRKWRRILQALQSGSREDLQGFRAEALAAKEWETLRNLDYFMTRLDPEGPWAFMVYYGTPYASFRARLEKIRSFPDVHTLSWGKGGEPFDLWFPGGDEAGLPHRLVSLLVSDLYRPVNGAEIFSILHEDEYFDIDSSLVRVRKMVVRAREWLKEVCCPVRIETDKSLYSARLEMGASLRVRKPVLGLSREHFLFQRYRYVDNPPNLAVEWAEALKVTNSNVSRILKSGVDAGVLRKSGQGRYTKYIPV